MSTSLLNDASIIQDAILTLFHLYSHLDCLYCNVETLIAHAYAIFLSGKARNAEDFNAFFSTPKQLYRNGLMLMVFTLTLNSIFNVTAL